MWVGDWVYDPASPPTPDKVDLPESKIKKLLGPKGEVLRTFSDKPPVGFHQGERKR